MVVPAALLFDAKLKVHGVYLPLSPMGKVNDVAPAGNIFFTPSSLSTPLSKIKFDAVRVPAIAAL